MVNNLTEQNVKRLVYGFLTSNGDQILREPDQDRLSGASSIITVGDYCRDHCLAGYERFNCVSLPGNLSDIVEERIREIEGKIASSRQLSARQVSGRREGRRKSIEEELNAGLHGLLLSASREGRRHYFEAGLRSYLGLSIDILEPDEDPEYVKQAALDAKVRRINKGVSIALGTGFILVALSIAGTYIHVTSYQAGFNYCEAQHTATSTTSQLSK